MDEEFSALKPESRPLRNIWAKYHDQLLSVASSRATKDRELLELMTDWMELDEGQF
jgi:hypothetical protein